MSNMNPRSRISGQHDVARDYDLFGYGRHAPDAEQRRHGAFIHVSAASKVAVLAMADDRYAKRFGIVERVFHDIRLANAPAVVGDRARAGADHFAEGRQLLAQKPFGNRSDGIHAAYAVLRALHHVADLRFLVEHRVGIGHAGD